MIHEHPVILLVLQEGQTAAITAHRLRLLGYDVKYLYRGEDVPHQIEADIPDLVLVETRLPGIDGFEVIGRLRQDSRTREVPVLACSADSSPDSVRSAYTSGANDYLIFPFDPATLERKVETLLAALPMMAKE